jgi:hypothetical protein
MQNLEREENGAVLFGRMPSLLRRQESHKFIAAAYLCH